MTKYKFWQSFKFELKKENCKLGLLSLVGSSFKPIMNFLRKKFSREIKLRVRLDPKKRDILVCVIKIQDSLSVSFNRAEQKEKLRFAICSTTERSDSRRQRKEGICHLTPTSVSSISSFILDLGLVSIDSVACRWIHSDIQLFLQNLLNIRIFLFHFVSFVKKIEIFGWINRKGTT